MNESDEFEDAAVVIGSLAGVAMAIVNQLKEIDEDATLRRHMRQQISQNHSETIELIRAAEEHILRLEKFIIEQARAAMAPRY
jgi:hypothetical protein